MRLMQIEKQRYERERTFHNWVFREKGRSSVGKFYSIAGISERYYRECILARDAHDVLEIGCGRGSVASFLGGDVSFTAIDISDVAVQQTAEVARANGISGTYLLMNAEETAFADDSFDLICSNSLEFCQVGVNVIRVAVDHCCFAQSGCFAIISLSLHELSGQEAVFRFLEFRRTTDEVLTKIRYLHQVAVSMRSGMLDSEGASQEIELTERQLHDCIRRLREQAGFED